MLWRPHEGPLCTWNDKLEIGTFIITSYTERDTKKVNRHASSLSSWNRTFGDGLSLQSCLSSLIVLAIGFWGLTTVLTVLSWKEASAFTAVNQRWVEKRYPSSRPQQAKTVNRVLAPKHLFRCSVPIMLEKTLTSPCSLYLFCLRNRCTVIHFRISPSRF